MMHVYLQVNLWTKHLIFKQNLLTANSNRNTEKSAIGQAKRKENKAEHKGENNENKAQGQDRNVVNADVGTSYEHLTNGVQFAVDEESGELPEYMDNPSLSAPFPPTLPPVDRTISGASVRRTISGASVRRTISTGSQVTASNLISLSNMHMVRDLECPQGGVASIFSAVSRYIHLPLLISPVKRIQSGYYFVLLTHDLNRSDLLIRSEGGRGVLSGQRVSR